MNPYEKEWHVFMGGEICVLTTDLEPEEFLGKIFTGEVFQDGDFPRQIRDVVSEVLTYEDIESIQEWREMGRWW